MCIRFTGQLRALTLENVHLLREPLLWYKHEGFIDGTFQWKGPVKVGIGWNEFATIVAGGDGVLYTMRPNGTLFWYRHDGFKYGGGMDTFRGPVLVGSGWGGFKTLFSMGEGILYAVSSNGNLLWYHHKGFNTGWLTNFR